ncbi:MAG: hypothetical protein JWL84_1017 [Rhodospirillales bacterium]|nr:hypothetical protein [Rhodospirillales bacterium]
MRGTCRLKYLAMAVVVALVFVSSRAGPAVADTASVPRIAFFGFHLINTSLEPTTPAEEARIRMLDDLFREKVGASGRFVLVPIPPDVRAKLAEGPDVGSCNGCERDVARKLGADHAAWGTVQKVSNLILNINVYMEDVQSGTVDFVKSVDIRGNTDESWRHGLDYLLRHYLFGEP